LRCAIVNDVIGEDNVAAVAHNHVVIGGGNVADVGVLSIRGDADG